MVESDIAEQPISVYRAVTTESGHRQCFAQGKVTLIY